MGSGDSVTVTGRVPTPGAGIQGQHAVTVSNHPDVGSATGSPPGTVTP